jgi:tRNA-specific 2-thiouridylase
MNLDKNKVAVGLSGGVDSTATAYILKEKGYKVIGITMVVSDGGIKINNINELQFVKDAKRVAELLNIPHYVVDFRETFRNTVIREFIDEYLQGRTPNPCATCNRVIKYGKLIEYAHSLGAYYFATGHYANISYDSRIKRYRIYRGLAERKDQGYMLYSLTQEQLKYIKLPLGEFSSKEEVRRLASLVDSKIGEKKDSTGICFIPDGDYKTYLASMFPQVKRKGNFVDISGNVIGQHNGIVNYTIGQRRGLGKNFNKPMFVINIDPEKNEIVLGDDKYTYSIGLIAKKPNFIIFDRLQGELEVQAKVCQWGYFLPATISSIGQDRIKVTFRKKERAIAPGQSVVFYKGNEIIGGGIIESVIK